MSHRRFMRAGLAGLALLFGVAAGPLATHVHAQLGSCRSDPVITLSDLRVLDMSATIGDAPADVKGVSYVLHGPVGVGIILAVKTPSFTSGVETFKYIADQRANTYIMDTTVTTGASRVSVTASTLLLSTLTNTLLYTSNATGYSGATLAMPFHDSPLL